MATKKKEKEIYRYPGPQQLQSFLKLDSDIFNLAGLDRLCGFPDGTLRHIRAGSREMTTDQYKKLQEVVLPKTCEFVLLLQLYDTSKVDRFNRNSWDDGNDY